MALNIANQKVAEKAILASRIPGTNKFAAVEQALDYFLKHCRPDAERITDIREVARLLDELADLPILDNRKTDEIIGDNEDCVPL